MIQATETKEEFLARYDAFLRKKINLETTSGFEVADSEVNPVLKKHQRNTVRWAVRGGQRAIFERFGMGKTCIALEIERLILERLAPGRRGLIVLLLGVKQEFYRDAVDLLGWSAPPRFVRTTDEVLNFDLFPSAPNIYLTNYQSVRDGKIDVSLFDVILLDEASALRGGGSTRTFREFMALCAGDRKTMDERTLSEEIKYRFVATATPSPNDYIELLIYAAWLGISDISGAKTRFFKRDSTKADNLVIHPHKEREFFLWLSTWALFAQKPSDICGCVDAPECGCDDGYILPEVEIVWHEVPVDHTTAVPDKFGQGRLLREATHGVVEAAKEKRDTLDIRIEKMKEILAASPDEHFIIWHDLEIERLAIDRAVPGVVSVYGTQDPDEREKSVIDFSDGRIEKLSTKPAVAGSGCNFQRYCHRAIYLGVGFKFNDFIQAFMRLPRYGQKHKVRVDLIYAESERRVKASLLRKWDQHNRLVERMTEIIQQYGLSHEAMAKELTRAFGCERVEITGENYRLVNNDSVLETADMPENSVGLILTSVPFSTQYEYSPSYNDFGHTDNNAHFFEQMDFLTPNLLRALQPGRIAAIHVKDRIVPGGMTGLGFQTAYPFHAKCIEHYTRHGFGYLGMKTIVTDVVRENNQTYRLGWSEQCKDGSKMGVGMPEYLLLFRKPPTDAANSYADIPVRKSKPKVSGDDGTPQSWSGSKERRPIIQNSGYSRSRWQIDAHGFTRSAGDRLLDPDELKTLPHATIFKLFRQYSLETVYNFEHHVRIGEELERLGKLPVTFMLLQPQSWAPDVWTDITRMLTLNGAQSAKGRELHLCPMQTDLADRVIAQFSMPGETVFDPFGGLGTVAYRAIKLGRKGISVELSPSYFLDSAAYCAAAERELAMPSLFDLLPDAETAGAEAVGA